MFAGVVLVFSTTGCACVSTVEGDKAVGCCNKEDITWSAADG